MNEQVKLQYKRSSKFFNIYNITKNLSVSLASWSFS